jgi:hypothetical protein
MERTLMQDLDAAFDRYVFSPLVKWTGIKWIVSRWLDVWSAN